ncbi:MAG: peptidoglycan recognition family protein [Myxococcota bacterium]
MKGLIYRGKLVPVDRVKLRDGREQELWWNEGDPGTRARRRALSSCVWHHTGGEGDGARVFRVLNGGRKSRKTGRPIYLSVHFTIDQYGVTIQHADLDTVCFHAGTANDWSVGVEMSSIGAGPSTRRFPRDEDPQEIRGQIVEYRDFYKEQYQAARGLARAISLVTGVPYRFPKDPEGDGLLRRDFNKAELRRWSKEGGHLGHFHVTDDKIDPTPSLLEDLASQTVPPFARSVTG